MTANKKVFVDSEGILLEPDPNNPGLSRPISTFTPANAVSEILNQNDIGSEYGSIHDVTASSNDADGAKLQDVNDMLVTLWSYVHNLHESLKSAGIIKSS